MENLKKLANAQLNGIIDTYKCETRDWWKHVDEDAIYEVIGEHKFDVYVRIFGTEDTHYGGARKAV